MSRYPQLPTCPAWCREEHGLQQTRHRRPIDVVQRMPPSQIEVEVNLCEDPTGPYVQVAINDYEIPEEQFPGLQHVFYRVPLDLANAWSHVANGMDARGALEVGQHIEYALDIYRTYQPCPHEWCVSNHSDPEWARSHISSPVRVAGLSAVRLLVEPEPVGLVQLNFTAGSHELAPAAALDLADILDHVGNDDVSVLADAIRTVASYEPTGATE